jgi:hypothetical protein
MKILILFAALSFSTIFSACTSNSGPIKADRGQSVSTMTDTRADYLSRHWVNSFEEQQRTDEQIFRLQSYKEFPPSRFRMQYVFHQNGDCEWYYLAPDDNHQFKAGKWRFDPKDDSIIEITKDGTIETYKIIELGKNILRIAPIPSNTGDSKAETAPN